MSEPEIHMVVTSNVVETCISRPRRGETFQKSNLRLPRGETAVSRTTSLVATEREVSTCQVLIPGKDRLCLRNVNTICSDPTIRSD